MHKRPTLNAGEYLLIYSLCILSPAHDHAGPWAPECLVCRGCNKLCIRHRGWMQSCNNQTCDMGDINHNNSANLVCNVPECLKIYNPWICTCADNNHLRFMLFCQIPNLVIVNSVVVFSD